MRRYGFLEEEKSKPKAKDKAGEVMVEKPGDVVSPGYITGTSASNSNKDLSVTVSYSTNVASDSKDLSVTVSYSTNVA